jgi:xylulokinase
MNVHVRPGDVSDPLTGSGSVTVGIDIGTTAVKAVAVDEAGTVLARSRVPHKLISPAPDLLEHDAGRAWRRGPLEALAAVHPVGAPLDAVCVCSMVPSLTAVDRRGRPRSPGLLYGDARGRMERVADGTAGEGLGSGSDVLPDAEGFIRWAVKESPGAHGYWPAQAVANFALGGVAAIDSGAAMMSASLLSAGQWDPAKLSPLGANAGQMPLIVPMGAQAGTVKGTDAALAGGTVDAFCDQIVSGADNAGDVLVICGATLIVWAVVDEWIDAPGLWTVPHTVAGKCLVGGPSNAGALFVDWARGLLHGSRRLPTTRRANRPDAGVGTDQPLPPRRGHPDRVPVWTPYLRGERAPFNDTTLRSTLQGLDITHDADALERAAYESTGFVVRHMLDLGQIKARRIVASGGGTRVTPWMQAMADASGLPVDVVAVHEGAALGAAFLARLAAGLEESLDDARRWARVGYRVEPDAVWQEAADKRYTRFRALGPSR